MAPVRCCQNCLSAQSTWVMHHRASKGQGSDHCKKSCVHPDHGPAILAIDSTGSAFLAV